MDIHRLRIPVGAYQPVWEKVGAKKVGTREQTSESMPTEPGLAESVGDLVAKPGGSTKIFRFS
ncbi:MAG: hypothetical protein LJE85_08560 [Gammaproteobacteria bacterium]|nr:hypothetical protein [Gammaproteobacteria bacterium]